MAMSDTMSGPNSHEDWLHFYDQQNLPPPPNQFLPSSSVSDATTVTTTTAQAQLSPEGRVSKPIRRRSRASRRTPTTLLNTDTTNFRAMVQQFTGAPLAPAPSSASGFPNLGLGFGSRSALLNQNGLMLAPSAFNLQQQQQQQQLLYEQRYIYSGGGGNSCELGLGGTGDNINNRFVHQSQRHGHDVVHGSDEAAVAVGEVFMGDGGHFFPTTTTTTTTTSSPS